MNIRISHKVILKKTAHRFIVVIECPFEPQPGFMFIFRETEKAGDDCALIVEDIYGWDATNQHLLVRTVDWNVDEWSHNTGGDADELFADAKEQLIRVARCAHEPPK